MFGEINDLRERAAHRLTDLHTQGINDAVVYDPQETSVGGIHAFFLLRGDPRQYNLPPKPEIPTIYAGDSWRAAAMAAGLLAIGTLFAFLGDNR
jgi:formate dehydrogenase iron-sulfur subunit